MPSAQPATQTDMRAWAGRAMANMVTRDVKDFSHRIGDIAGAAVLRYEPIWRPHESYQCGYLATRPGGPDRATTVDLSWEDLILLGAATRELQKLIGAGGKSVLLLPVSAGTLGMRQINDLYCFCFRNLSPVVKHHIVLELGNMPAHGLSTEVEDKIRGLASQCRAVVINTASPLRKYDPVRFVTPQAYGFDLASPLCAGQDPATLCRRFRARYGSHGRMYITGVNSPEAMGAAVENGFVYISGRAVAACPDRIKAAQPLTIQDLAMSPLRYAVAI